MTPLALAGTAAGASGLVVEIHDDPAHAFSDGAQALKPNEYKEMAEKALAIRDLMTGMDNQQAEAGR